jgi:hypothetical protein
MSKSTVAETDFYLFTKMAGIQQIRPNKFIFEDRTYTAHARVDQATAKAFGGKQRAFKLLRHAELIRFLAAQPSGFHLFGIVGKSFNEVSQQYPILRSYYTSTQIGASHQTWLRWS